jgi:glycosyltransferase involved in cell wall biosynthesis
MLPSFTHTITLNLSPSITSDLTSLRVAILSLGGLGGSGKVATELARELTIAGASVWLLTSPQAQWVSNDELKYIPVSAPKTPTPADSKWIVPLAQEIIQHVETNNINVLNVHYAVGLVEAALEARQELASRGYSLSICLTLHGSDVNKYGCDSNYNAQLRDCILACDCVTAVSNSLASQAVRIFSLPRRPIVIHNAIDLELFHPYRKWIAAPFIITGTLSAYGVFFLIMILLALRLSPLQALLTTLVREHQRGSLMSLVVAVGQLGGGLGGIAAGVAYAEFGYIGNAFLSALFIGLTGLIVWCGLEEPSHESTSSFF